MSEKICVDGLIIDPVVLADIQRQCKQRRAELEAAGTLPRLLIAPGSSRSDFDAASALSSIPPLENGFWQSLLYGSVDSLVPGSDATRSLREVGDKLGVVIAEGETIETLRAGQLRKLLREKFGYTEAEQALALLWREAPASPGAPVPALDQSSLPPGPWPVTRNQPAWRHDFHREVSGEQQLLEETGGFLQRIVYPL